MQTYRNRFSVISGFSFLGLNPKTKTRKSQKVIEKPKILKYQNRISRTFKILFKWRHSENNSVILLIICHAFVFQEILIPLDLLTWVWFLYYYFSFNAQKVEAVIEKQVHMHLSFMNQNIYLDFLVFILSCIPKKKNSEITEILQKRHNTKIWQCSFENNWDDLQIPKMPIWFSLILNQVLGICLLRFSNPSRFIKWKSFLHISVLVLIISKYRPTFI